MSTSIDSSNRPDISPPPADQQPAGPSGPRLWPRVRRPRWLLAISTAAAPAAAGAAAVALIFGNPGSISIVSGWFPVALFWTTVACCLIAVVLRRDLLHECAIGIPVGIAFVVLLYVGFHLTQAIPAGAPQSMYVWLCVASLVGGLVVAGWRRAHWPRRICGIMAVFLAVVSAGSAVNETFAYYPTFDRLLGQSANHFLDNAQLTAMRREAAKTGQLPDHGATLSVTIPGDGLKYTPRQAYVWVPPAWFGRNQLKGAYAVGPLAASQATLLIVDPLVSISLGIELFHDQLGEGPGYVLGAVVSLAVLAAGVIMLSIWAPPVMTAESLGQLHHGSGARLEEHADARPVV